MERSPPRDIRMKKAKICLSEYGQVSVFLETESGFDRCFYVARNKSLYLAIQECFAYMSSFTNVMVFLDTSLQEYIDRDPNNGKSNK